MILTDIDIKFFLCTIKLKQPEKAKNPISPLPDKSTWKLMKRSNNQVRWQ